MAEEKTNKLEREYVIPLRPEWMKVSRYKRSRRAVMAIKAFIARHMRVQDRDLDKVKLDVYLNNEVWFRGAKKPPAKIKVKATKEGDSVFVELVDMPDKWKYVKARQEKIHKKAEKPTKKAEKKEEKSEDADNDGVEDKKEETEKEKSVAEANEKILDQTAKAQKHTQFKKPDKAPLQRKALKK